VAQKLALARSNAEPEQSHRRTAMLPAAFTRMFPIKPGSNPLGHPGITASPAAAPSKANVISPQLAGAMLVKSSVAVAVR
jgi:hypothetical protein